MVPRLTSHHPLFLSSLAINTLAPQREQLRKASRESKPEQQESEQSIQKLKKSKEFHQISPRPTSTGGHDPPRPPPTDSPCAGYPTATSLRRQCPLLPQIRFTAQSDPTRSLPLGHIALRRRLDQPWRPPQVRSPTFVVVAGPVSAELVLACKTRKSIA